MAVSVGALPAILPVLYVIDADAVVFSLAHGSPSQENGVDGHVVAFQAEGDGGNGRWSVSLTGVAFRCPDSAGTVTFRLVPAVVHGTAG